MHAEKGCARVHVNTCHDDDGGCWIWERGGDDHRGVQMGEMIVTVVVLFVVVVVVAVVVWV